MSGQPGSLTASNVANYDTDWSVTQYGTRAGELFPIEQQLIAEFFSTPPARLLDIGCGAGRTTLPLHARGYQVTGIDLSERLLAEARRRDPSLDLRVMDATALAFEAGSFDAALFSFNGIDCIYPVRAREACFAEAFRVLRPGAVFMMSSHNACGALLSGGYFYLRGHVNALKWLWQQVDNRHRAEWYWRYDDPGGTQYLYSAPPSHTIAQARAAGFEVLAVRGETGERDVARIARHQKHVYFVLAKP